MAWSAISRYRTTEAPEGLAFVHDFLSTAPVDYPAKADLLATRDLAQAWLDDAVASWPEDAAGAVPEAVELSDGDLPALRRLRSSLLAAIGVPTDEVSPAVSSAPIQAKLSIALDADGQVSLGGDGAAAKRLTGVLLEQTYEAQQAGAWRRLKACRNPHCRIVFYDRSKNNSRVWDDVTSCGNTEHLRAFRARKRAEVDEQS